MSSGQQRKELDLHSLKIFNIVAKHQSFTKAAIELHISQPAISIQIRKLEALLDVKLFDKIGNKVELNQNGALLYEYTLKIFTLVAQAENDFQTRAGYISGELFIGGSNTPGTYILPKIIGAFKKLYPNVKVDLHISNTDEIASLVEKGKLDFAVNGGDIPYPDHIQATYLMSDQLIIAASPQNRLASYTAISKPDLIDQELIAHETNSQLYKKVYDFALDFGLENRLSYTLGNISSIKQAVEANMGISLIPYSAMSLELSLGLISSLKINDANYTYPYYLIYNHNKYISPAGKLLINIIEETFKNIKTNPSTHLQ